MPRYYGYGYPPMGYNQGLGVRGVLIVTAIIIALIVGIFIYARVQANKDIAGQLPGEYKDGISAEESEKIRSFATSLQADLEGVSFSHNWDLYDQILKQTDAMFKNICIDYNRLTKRSLKADFVADGYWFRFNEPIFPVNTNYYDKMMKAFERNSII